MKNSETIIDVLIKNFSSLPGIGRKSAARIVYHLLKEDSFFTDSLADNIKKLKETIKPCPVCGCYTDAQQCGICSDSTRNKKLLCVVENPQDIDIIESTGAFDGYYHVLMGLLSPIDGIGPEKLNVYPLISRIEKGEVEELIFALNPSVEGETTALYIQKMLENRGIHIKVTRLASGLPVGGDLEYVDRMTLTRSLLGRTSI